jgi:hypothetical protein
MKSRISNVCITSSSLFWGEPLLLASEQCFFFLLLTISDYGIVMINVFIPKMSSLMIY